MLKFHNKLRTKNVYENDFVIQQRNLKKEFKENHLKKGPGKFFKLPVLKLLKVGERIQSILWMQIQRK